MSRRRFIASSSDYEPPMTEEFEHDLDTRLQLLSLLENPAPAPLSNIPGPIVSQAQLARMLSVRPVVSTASSFAAQQTKAQEKDSKAQTYRKIGAGACGAIFASDGVSLAYKIGKTGSNDDDNALRTDFEMHQRILKALRDFNADIEIPTCHFFTSHEDKAWWDDHKELAMAAQATCHTPARVLVTERILPLPAPIRTGLIQTFCKESLQTTAAMDPANKDCLVRVYLGSTRGRIMNFFSLRNFKLHLNQMIDLKFDYEALAVSMGQALALIHWKARTDGRDIEFALGSSTTRASANPQQSSRLDYGTRNLDNSGTEDFTHRETRLFVLDFNQVREISMDDAGVECAIQAFFINDPYYPRPRQESRLQQELWNSFVRSYLATSDMVLDDEQEYRVLPRKFIAGIIDRA
ncbi:zinc finger protein-domain-containing protein [Stachybotrys elegans]|uniref:Zinc finger protein-domain-containing protein n=1 Tax=Stachybotrys elegans TaxID=80388 RepID=A0A8K0WKP5_9HYPO|nr:zinc finger protein-domain-containing protein [Stachybotrys elegans]